MLDRFRSQLDVRFEGYYGLKRSLAAITILWSIFVLTLVYSKHRFVPLVAEFVLFYWFRNAWTAIKFVGFLAAMMWLLKRDILKRQYTKFFGYYEHLEPPIYRMAPTWATTLITAGLVILWVPFIDLYTTGFQQYSLKLFSLLPMFVKALLVFAKVPRVDHVDGLNKFHYQKRYFNPAGLGAKCLDLDKRVSDINHYSGALNDETGSRNAIISGHKRTVWKGVNALLIKLAIHLDCEATLITLHERTTDAVQFAIEECCKAFAKSGKTARIVYSDAEYPKLVDRALRKAEADFKAELYQADILSLITAGREGEAVTQKIVEACRSMRADVLMISHVIFSFGYVLDH